MKWYVIRVNPAPWAIGPVGYSRRGGKMSAYVGRNQELHAYQEAIKEELGPQPFVTGKISLHFYFWRNRPEYQTPQARAHRKHEADVTNLQKGCDALQGILFANDRDVKRVTSEIVAQGPEVEPCIVVGIESYQELPLPDIVAELYATTDGPTSKAVEWEAPDGAPF